MLNIKTGIDPAKLSKEEIAMIFAIDSINESIRMGEIDGPMIKINNIEETITDIIAIGKEPNIDDVKGMVKSLIININGYGSIDRFLAGTK